MRLQLATNVNDHSTAPFRETEFAIQPKRVAIVLFKGAPPRVVLPKLRVLNGATCPNELLLRGACALAHPTRNAVLVTAVLEQTIPHFSMKKVPLRETSILTRYAANQNSA